MRKVDIEKSQEQVNALLKIRKHNRRPRPEPYPDLLKHVTQILTWARTKGSSKAILAKLCKNELKLTVSGDRLYRFVKHINGRWPNSRQNKKGEN